MTDNRDLTHDERLDLVEQRLASLQKTFADLGNAVNEVLLSISRRMDEQDARLTKANQNAQQSSIDAQRAQVNADAAHNQIARLADATHKVTTSLQELTIAVTKPSEASPPT